MDRQHPHAPRRRQGLPPLPPRTPEPGRFAPARSHRPHRPVEHRPVEHRLGDYRSSYRDAARRDAATSSRGAAHQGARAGRAKNGHASTSRWPWAPRARKAPSPGDPRKAAAAAVLAERRAKARRARSRSTALHLDLHASGLPGRPHVNPIGLSVTLILAVMTWVILLAQPFGGAVLGPTMPSSAFIIIVGLGLFVMWQLDNKYD